MFQKCKEFYLTYKLQIIISNKENREFFDNFINKVDKIPEMLNISEKVIEDYRRIREAHDIRKRNYRGKLSNLSKANRIFLRTLDDINFLDDINLNRIRDFYGFPVDEEQRRINGDYPMGPKEILAQLHKSDAAQRDRDNLDSSNL